MMGVLTQQRMVKLISQRGKLMFKARGMMTLNCISCTGVIFVRITEISSSISNRCIYTDQRVKRNTVAGDMVC